MSQRWGEHPDLGGAKVTPTVVKNMASSSKDEGLHFSIMKLGNVLETGQLPFVEVYMQLSSEQIPV